MNIPTLNEMDDKRTGKGVLDPVPFDQLVKCARHFRKSAALIIDPMRDGTALTQAENRFHTWAATYREYDGRIASNAWMQSANVGNAWSHVEQQTETEKVPDHPGPHNTDKTPVGLMTVPGYASLADVLTRAYIQAAVGKGHARHANNEPFDEQVMQDGARRFGVGGLLFQAYKKSEESQRMELGPAVNELLGAINYLAGAVIALEKKKVSSQ